MLALLLLVDCWLFLVFFSFLFSQRNETIRNLQSSAQHRLLLSFGPARPFECVRIVLTFNSLSLETTADPVSCQKTKQTTTTKKKPPSLALPTGRTRTSSTTTWTASSFYRRCCGPSSPGVPSCRSAAAPRRSPRRTPPLGSSESAPSTPRT